MQLNAAFVRLRSIKIALLLTFVAMSNTGCAKIKRGYVPPEALDPPASNFSTAIATFSQNVQKDHLATYRRDVRHDLFVATVRDFMESENPNAEQLARMTDAESPTDFLCLPRYGYQRVAVRVGNLDAVGTALGERLKASSDDISKLFQALGTSYTIRTNAKEPPGTYDEWERSEDGKRCVDSVKNGDPFITRTYVGTEFAFAAVPAAIAVAEAVWAVVKPVAVGTLKNIDLERRNAAVREYFEDEKNVDALKLDLKDTEDFLQKEFQLSQVRSAGQAASAAAILFDPAAAHWTKIKQIAGTAKCRSAIVRLKSDRTEPAGVTCLNDALAAASGPLEQALNSADAFDAAMGQQLPKDSDRLSVQVDTLRDIALGKQPNEAKVEALWAATLRYAALFQTAKDAASAANQKKIDDAISALLKTMQ